jgi:hypothetical protein
LGLEGGLKIEWDRYIGNLVENFIRLKIDENDLFVWSKNPLNGAFIAKLGYKDAMEFSFSKEKRWWWNFLWKLSAPLK